MDIIGSILARNGINALKASGGAGYTTSQKVEILAEITVPLLDAETGEYEIILPFPLNVGWYEFRINGVSHLAFISNVAGCAIGANVAETANEAYCGEYGDGVIYLGFVDGSAPATITFAIWQETELIHPIDPKYIPGAVLPVVEMTTVPTAGGTPLTEAEAAAIDALNGKPCIVVFNGVFGNFTSKFEAYASCTILNGVIAQYETSRLLILGGQLLLVNEDCWVAVIEQ